MSKLTDRIKVLADDFSTGVQAVMTEAVAAEGVAAAALDEERAKSAALQKTIDSLLASPPAPDPSPPLISPDGDTAPPLAKLYTLEGEWSWGRMVDERGYALLLNGQETGNVGIEMFMEGGTIWHKNSGTPVWCGYRKDGKWTAAADPRTTSTPTPAAKALSGVLSRFVGPCIWPNWAGQAASVKANWFSTGARICYHPTDLTNIGTVADVIARITEWTGTGQWAIADWHKVSGTANEAEAKLCDAFFDQILAVHLNNALLACEVWNEYGALPTLTQAGGKYGYEKGYADAYVAYMRARIAHLRGKGFNGPIIISALDWANDLMRAPGYALVNGQPIEEVSSIVVLGPRIQDGYDNIVFSVHPYDSWTNSPRAFTDFCAAAAKAGVKFMVTETGMWNWERACAEGQKKAFAALQTYDFGIVGWHAQAADKNDFTSPDTGMTLKKDAAGTPTNLSDPQGKLFFARGKALQAA